METKNKSELDILMDKIEKSMKMSMEQKNEIADMNSQLMEEIRPMMVEKTKIEIAKKEEDKKEFDEMTVDALKRAKVDVLKKREQSEKEYNEKLVQSFEKQERIKKQLESFESKGLEPEKEKMAKETAKRVLAKNQREMKKYQRDHMKLRETLNNYESKINSYAIELGVKGELDKINIESIKEDEQKDLNEKSINPNLDEKEGNQVSDANGENASQNLHEENQVLDDKGEGTNPTQKEGNKGNGQATISNGGAGINPNQIESIDFKFEEGKPNYTVTFKNGEVHTFKEIAGERFDNLYKNTTKENKKVIDEKIGFKNAYKFADPFLVKFLEKYDNKYGTTELARYAELLKDGREESEFDSEKDYINISYDMTDMHESSMDKKALRALKKIAKRDERYGIAEYTKPKSKIAMIIDKYIRTPRIANKSEVSEEQIDEIQTEAEDKTITETSKESKTNKDVFKQYKVLNKEMESFNKTMTKNEKTTEKSNSGSELEL